MRLLLPYLFALPLLAEPFIAGLVHGDLDPALRGAVLVEELNCAACHAGAGDPKAAKAAPRLAKVSERLNPRYIEAFIADPHGIKPGSTMPATSAESATALTHFLLSLGKPFAPEPHDRFAAEAGEKLFHSVGCVACHSPRDKALPDSVPLGALERQYSVRSLTDFLRNPQHIRPGGRMPDMRLQGQEAYQIANYLLRDTRLPGRLNYRLWQGRVWEGLDENVEQVRAGHTDAFSLDGLGKIGNNNALIFDGFLKVEKAGEYPFRITANGSRLRVNGEVLGEIAPHHHRGAKVLEAKASLKAGWNAIELLYFHMGRDPSLKVEMPDGELSISTQPIPAYQPYPLDKALAEKGRAEFAKLGCARCHDDVKVKSEPGPEWATLDLNKSCGGADFRLSPAQQAWIRARPKQFTARQRIDKTLASLNCIACHERAGVGGIEEVRDEYFTGSHPELGNEGRLPPPLTGIGAKLLPDWLRGVLMNGHRQRAYLHTRMPNYSSRDVEQLPALLAEVDRVEPVEFASVADAQPYKDAGLKFVGNTGFTCIACHDFNGEKSAVGGLELIGLPERVHKDWFYHFMVNPAHFRPGIVMPSFWPGGVSLRPDILGGDSKAQIDAIWTYLLDGKRVRSPQGLARQSRELRVADEAVIVRGRGTPAGYRGIGVGYPAGVNLAFDSEQLYLVAIWQGDFAHSDNGRFGWQGSDRIQFAPGIPFHRLPDPEAPWPYKRKTDYLFPQDQGYQYRGYFLGEKKRPTFMYHYGDIAIQDHFVDRPKGFTRSLSFVAKSAQEPFVFRVATGSSIKAIDGGFQVDSLKLRISQAAEIRLVETHELLVPLSLPAGTSTLTVEYDW
jgi:cytochrome c553